MLNSFHSFHKIERRLCRPCERCCDKIWYFKFNKSKKQLLIGKNKSDWITPAGNKRKEWILISGGLEKQLNVNKQMVAINGCGVKCSYTIICLRRSTYLHFFALFLVRNIMAIEEGNKLQNLRDVLTVSNKVQK